jgi:hypothetical protein
MRMHVCTHPVSAAGRRTPARRRWMELDRFRGRRSTQKAARRIRVRERGGIEALRSSLSAAQWRMPGGRRDASRRFSECLHTPLSGRIIDPCSQANARADAMVLSVCDRCVAVRLETRRLPKNASRFLYQNMEEPKLGKSMTSPKVFRSMQVS